jgi:hypothetical protein
MRKVHMAYKITISISIAGVRREISPEGLEAVISALEVGADGFGMGDGDEDAENEAWEVIKQFKAARDGLRRSSTEPAGGAHPVGD